MEEQLLDLYEQRLILEAELGTADTATIVRMFRSLREQLDAIYAEYDEAPTTKFAGPSSRK